jgi:hypothetical protein
VCLVFEDCARGFQVDRVDLVEGWYDVQGCCRVVFGV